MPLYRYKALNARGEVLDGQMEAANDSEVASRLQEQGHLPVEALLSERLKLSEINEGFDRLARGEAIRQVVVM